ncbi:uncharacterized protein LOC119670207 isoform X2 [Teleopsis dalmanni]|uniref:uncharacterized protein LOC119670207 isoform X2 n=1 Tax=Teleopsis dalmanni TaxID=139649 RepID=UPI0018CD541F|nr:uncharacterized protein LOC119670207 isoform X2 [Teleopsis dalmanni]
MPVKKLIRKVKENEILYRKPFIKNNLTEEQKKKWMEIANSCNIESGAISMWQTVLYNYRNYLTKGTKFTYANDMQFMQAFIFEDELCENSTLNVEYDENELDRILNSEDEDNQCTILEKTRTNNVRDKTIEKNDLKQNEMNLVVQERVSHLQEHQCVENDTNGDFTQSFNHTNLSSLELIFLGYAKLVQSMSLPLQIQTKKKILNIMEEAELQMLNEK